MKYLNLITGCFFVVPLIIILINNLLPKETEEAVSLKLAGFASVLQIIVSIIGFINLATSNLKNFNFSLLWDLNQKDAAFFSVNLLSLFLLFCIGFTVFISVLVSVKTMKDKKISYVNLLMILVLGLNGMVIATDLFSLYVFLEVVGIASFIMIALFKSQASLEGAFKYLVMSAIASIFILTGLAFIFMNTKSLLYSEVSMSILNNINGSQSILIYAAFIFIIVGFSIKTGSVPFHNMVPDAYQSADTSISLLLSGIVIKIAGIYGLIVLTNLFNSIPVINITLAVIGTISILIGALFAIRQNNFKRMIAYSSISQAGYIVLGLSAGPLGLLGAVIHIFNHATAKCTLFSNAEALNQQIGTYDLNEMGGLQNKMPVTSFSSLTAFLSTAGIPPFAGFWSKLLIVMALWINKQEIFAAIALFASIFTAGYFLVMQKKVFFGKLPDKFKEVKDIKGSIKFAQIILTIVTIAVGVAFPLALLYLKTIGII